MKFIITFPLESGQVCNMVCLSRLGHKKGCGIRSATWGHHGRRPEAATLWGSPRPRKRAQGGYSSPESQQSSQSTASTTSQVSAGAILQGARPELWAAVIPSSGPSQPRPWTLQSREKPLLLCLPRFSTHRLCEHNKVIILSHWVLEQCVTWER